MYFYFSTYEVHTSVRLGVVPRDWASAQRAICERSQNEELKEWREGVACRKIRNREKR